MNKIVRKEKILVDKDKIPQIAEHFGCSRVCVYNALAFKSNSDLSSDIRNTTLNRYGGVRVRMPMVVK